jgi:hypothetical protein
MFQALRGRPSPLKLLRRTFAWAAWIRASFPGNEAGNEVHAYWGDNRGVFTPPLCALGYTVASDESIRP